MAKTKSVKVYELEKELYELQIKLIKKNKKIKKIDREAQLYFENYMRKIHLTYQMAQWIAKQDFKIDICKNCKCQKNKDVTDCCEKCILEYFEEIVKKGE